MSSTQCVNVLSTKKGDRRGSATIAAVTVAFQGEEFLNRHIGALLGQTRPIDEIIIVNNGSCEKTSRLLALNFPAVKVINLPTNLGVGGGLAAGLSYAALHRNHQWVWMLDQDSVPDANSLELLIGGLQLLGDSSEQAAILAPLCVNSEAKVSYPGMVWRNGWRKPDKESMKLPVVFVDSVISSGALVRREAVEKVGVPREDLFMDFVDHEYCLRLRRAGYQIAIVSASRLEHEIGSTQQKAFLGISHSWSCHAPWREYYMTRNEIFTIWKYYPNWRSKWFTVRRLLRHAFAILLFGQQKHSCLKMMWNGCRDGLAQRMGIRTFESG